MMKRIATTIERAARRPSPAPVALAALAVFAALLILLPKGI